MEVLRVDYIILKLLFIYLKHEIAVEFNLQIISYFLNLLFFYVVLLLLQGFTLQTCCSWYENILDELTSVDDVILDRLINFSLVQHVVICRAFGACIRLWMAYEHLIVLYADNPTFISLAYVSCFTFWFRKWNLQPTNEGKGKS